MDYLRSALNEVASASELTLKSPASIDLLEQACELLELANSAVNDRSISTQTYKLKSKVVAFINVVSSKGDYGDIQACFQEILNNCAILEDMCNDAPVVSDVQSPSVVNMMNNESKRNSKQLEEPSRDTTFGQDSLSALQRQILGLDDETDREHLEKVGLSNYIGIDKTSSNNKVEEEKARNIVQEEVASAEERQIEDPLRCWPEVIAATRDMCNDESQSFSEGSMIENGSVSASRMLGTESDDADMIGDLGQFLNGMISSLEKQSDRMRALENAKRLPPFARRDAVIAIRANLEEIHSRGKECVFELTSLLTNDVMSLLNSKSSMLAVCDALEALAIAWQTRCRRESVSKNDSVAKMQSSTSHPIHEARRLVDVANASVYANSRRRRVAMAAATMKQELEAKSASNEWYVNSKNDEGESVSILQQQHVHSSFDIYARKPIRKMGKAAREVGKQRKKQEAGSIHLSRHCEYEPSFNDISGLAVGTSQIVINKSAISQQSTSSQFPKQVGPRSSRSCALNTASVFKAPLRPEAKRWVLSDEVGSIPTTNQTNSTTSMISPPSNQVDMSALHHYQQKLSVSIPTQNSGGGRRVAGGGASSKKSLSMVSPQLTF